jgi:hypothetical protein
MTINSASGVFVPVKLYIDPPPKWVNEVGHEEENTLIFSSFYCLVFQLLNECLQCCIQISTLLSLAYFILLASLIAKSVDQQE